MTAPPAVPSGAGADDGREPDHSERDPIKGLAELVLAISARSSQVEQLLKASGFDELTDQGDESTSVKALVHKSGAIIVGLYNDVSLDGLQTGGLNLGERDGQICLSLRLANPNKQGVVDAITSKSKADLSPDELLSVLVNMLGEQKIELVKHECQHMQDVLNGTWWGRVWLTSYVGAMREREKLHPSLSRLLLAQEPTPEALDAARFIMELRGFAHNKSTYVEFADRASKGLAALDALRKDHTSANLEAGFEILAGLWNEFPDPYRFGEGPAFNYAFQVWVEHGLGLPDGFD